MRSISALFFVLLVFAPFAFALEESVPLALEDLKLESVSWQFPVPEFTQGAHFEKALVDGDDLFVVDSKNIFHCVKLATGVHRWVIELRGELTHAPGLTDSTIGLVVKDRLILATRKSGSRYLDKALTILPATAPAVTPESAFVGIFIENRLMSVDAARGTTGWSYRFRDFVSTAPKVYGQGAHEYLYAGANDGSLVCLPLKRALDAAPAKPLWVLETHGPLTAELVFSGDRLYVASQDTSLYALNRMTGGIDWKYYAGVALEKAPQEVGDSVYLNIGTEFLCLNKDKGEKKWSHETGEVLAAKIGEVAYLWTRDNSLVMVNDATGEVIAEVVPEKSIKVIPNIASEMLVVVSGDTVYGLK